MTHFNSEYRLSNSIELIDNEGSMFLVKEVSTGQFWRINKSLFQILRQFGEDEKVNCLGKPLKRPVNLEIIQEELLSRGWLVAKENTLDLRPPKNKSPAYLYWPFTIIPAKRVNWLANRLTILFHPVCCFITFFILFSSIYWFGRAYSGSLIIDGSKSVAFVFLMFLSVLFHELGHAAALIRYNQKSGRIGGAFYLLSPVMFTDVTNAWALPKRGRLLVNVAGMYFESVFCAIGMGILQVFGHMDYSGVLVLVWVKTFWNINPFLRSDGYWFLSDLMNVPNLRRRSVLVWKELLKEGFQIKLLPLLIYGFCSAIVIGFFFTYTLILHRDLILELPGRLLRMITTFKANGIYHISWGEIIPMASTILLYFIICKLVYTAFRHLFERMQRKCADPS